MAPLLQQNDGSGDGAVAVSGCAFEWWRSVSRWGSVYMEDASWQRTRHTEDGFGWGGMGSGTLMRLIRSLRFW